MKKFRFPLKTVATVRSLVEMRAREHFSQCVQAFVAAQEQRDQAQKRLTEYENMLRDGRSNTFRGSEQAAFLVAFNEQTAQVSKAEAQIGEAAREMEVVRQAWLGSRRDVRVIENLEAKARRAHQFELEREIQAALDDRTSALAARNSNTLS